MRRKISKNSIIALAAVLCAAIVFVSYALTRTPFSERKPAVNDAAPEFVLSDVYGRMLRLTDFSGKVVLVNFWAGYCPPCIEELSAFQKLYESYESKGFVVIAIAMDDINPVSVHKMGVTFPVAMTRNKITADYGDIKNVPVSFLVGKDGRIIRKANGVYSEKELRGDVENALAR